MDKIIIKGLKIFAYHGVNESEKIDGQDFVIDVIMGVSTLDASKSDDIDDTVSYSKVVKEITALVTSKSCDLIETVANEIADMILENHNAVTSVKVTVKKPSAPIKANLDFAAVSIKRKRYEK